MWYPEFIEDLVTVFLRFFLLYCILNLAITCHTKLSYLE